MVQTLSLIGAAFAVGGSYFALDSLRDVLVAKTINAPVATRLGIASAAVIGGLFLFGRSEGSAAGQRAKETVKEEIIAKIEAASEQFAAEPDDPNYMVKSDIHKIAESGIRMTVLIDEYPDADLPVWLKSKLSVTASEADGVADNMGYALADPEAFDAEGTFTKGQKNDLLYFYLAYKAHETGESVGMIHPDEWNQIALGDGRCYEVNTTGHDDTITRKTLKSLLGKGLVEATRSDTFLDYTEELNEDPDLAYRVSSVCIRLTPRGVELIKGMYARKEMGAEGTKVRRHPLDRFTRPRKPSANYYRRKGRRAAISSLFSADSQPVPDWSFEEELAIGTREEMEHTDDPEEAERIAREHLKEDPDYYTKLSVVGLISSPNDPIPALWFSESEIYEAECASCDTTHGFDFMCATCGLCLDCDPCTHDSRARGPFTDKNAEEFNASQGMTSYDDEPDDHDIVWNEDEFSYGYWEDGQFFKLEGTKFTCDCGAECTVDATTEIAFGPGGYDLRCGRNDDCRGDEKVLGAEWDESSRTMWDQSEITDPDELVRLGKIFKVGNDTTDSWQEYLDESGPFVYVTKNTRPWALWQPGSREAVVRFNSRGKIASMLVVDDVKQLYEAKPEDYGFDAEVLGAESSHFYGNCGECKKPMMVGTKVTDRHGVTGQIKPSKICQECDHVVCGSCHPRVKVCPHCEESFGAEVFEAFSLSDRPVSVKFGPGTSGNAKMKATFTDASGDTKTTQFGYKGMSDFTKHKDEGRRSSYLARHGSKGQNQNWKDPTTAGALSRYVLWEKTSLPAAKSAFKKRFNLRAEEDDADTYVGYQTSPFISESDRASIRIYEPIYSEEESL